MFDKLANDRIPEALVRADAQWHETHDSLVAASREHPLNCTIAISREVGARGTTIAEAVGRRLGWPVYDHELVEQIAREMNLRVFVLDSIDERHRTWVQQCVDAFFSGRSVPEVAYVHCLAKTLLSLASRGRCIIVGRGAAQVLPPESTLRVRVIAPLNDRVWTVMGGRHLKYDEAHRFILETEESRSRFIRDNFFSDPTDPHNYDLILNSARCSTDECADLIVDALRSMPQSGVPADQPGDRVPQEMLMTE